MHDTYLDRLEQARLLSGTSGEAGEDNEDGTLTTARESIFSKGQSKRIWNELYKVIDSSDVILHVIDARDPLGTRCRSVEKYLREEAPHKHLVFVLNKVDLVPSRVAVSSILLSSSDIPFFHFLIPIVKSRTLSFLYESILLQLWEMKYVSPAHGRYGFWVDLAPSWSLVTRVRVSRLS